MTGATTTQCLVVSCKLTKEVGGYANASTQTYHQRRRTCLNPKHLDLDLTLVLTLVLTPAHTLVRSPIRNRGRILALVRSSVLVVAMPRTFIASWDVRGPAACARCSGKRLNRSMVVFAIGFIWVVSVLAAAALLAGLISRPRCKPEPQPPKRPKHDPIELERENWSLAKRNRYLTEQLAERTLEVQRLRKDK